MRASFRQWWSISQTFRVLRIVCVHIIYREISHVFHVLGLDVVTLPVNLQWASMIYSPMYLGMLHWYWEKNAILSKSVKLSWSTCMIAGMYCMSRHLSVARACSHVTRHRNQALTQIHIVSYHRFYSKLSMLKVDNSHRPSENKPMWKNPIGHRPTERRHRLILRNLIFKQKHVQFIPAMHRTYVRRRKMVTGGERLQNAKYLRSKCSL